MKTIIWIVIAVVIAGAAAFGGFEEGKAYQTNQASQIRSQFLQSRGINPNGGQNGSSSNGSGRGAGFGGGVVGSLTGIQGNTLTISTANGVTTVNLSASTQIEKSVSASTSDLQTGDQLTVRGQRNSDGSVNADQVQILPAGTTFGAPQTTPTP